MAQYIQKEILFNLVTEQIEHNARVWDEFENIRWRELTQAELDEIAQEEAEKQAKDDLKAQLVGLFETKLENLEGIKALYEPVMLKAVQAFDNDNMELVYKIIDTSLTFGVTELVDLRAELLQALGGVE